MILSSGSGRSTRSSAAPQVAWRTLLRTRRTNPFSTILLRRELYRSRWIWPRASSVLEIRSEPPSDRAIEEPDSTEWRGRNDDQPAWILWHVNDSVRDTSHFARQAENFRRSTVVGGGQRFSSFMNSPVWRTRDRLVALAMRLLGRLEITSGWSHAAKHIPGVQNVVADGISRSPKEKIARNPLYAS